MSSTPGNREVAHRLFAAEFEEASYSYSESDEERAPNYVVTPTGARVNRLFVVGVLTEVAQAGDSILRARVVDPTGAFVVYAGQYQPEAMSFLDSAETPAFVAVTGKARTFQPEDSDLVYTSVRPESMNEVDASTRDRWTVTAAERTLERIGVFTAALDTGLTGDTLTEALQGSGVDASLAAGIPIAIEQYGTTTAYLAALQDVVLDVVGLVADETDEVGELTYSPGEGGEESFTPVKPVEIDATVAAAGVADSATPEASLTDGEAVDGPTDVSEGPTTESAPEAADDTESATGDIEPVEAVDSDDVTADGEPAFDDPEGVEDTDGTTETDVDEEAYEMDDETREEVESEYGTDFSTGNEVDPAGKADIETPAPDEADEERETAVETTAEPEDEPSFEPTGGDAADEITDDTVDDTATEDTATETTASDAEVTDETDADAAADVPLDTVLVEEMRALDDGDGAPRDELVARVTDRTGADEEAVDDAIQEALMSGQCYEPEDGRLKPI